MKFFMENNNQRVFIFVTIATILILVIIFAGVTYAFFTANNPKGSTAQIISTSGRMLLNYNDGTDNIIPITNIQPSNNILVDKTFSLTGINTTSGEGINMPYVVSIEYQSTFKYKNSAEFAYFIRRVDENENISCALKGMMENFPLEEQLGISESGYKYTGGYFEDWSGETYKQELAKGEFKAVSGEQVITFNLKMMFIDTESNQDYNKGATFNGKIVINEGQTSEVAQGETAVDTIDKQLITQDNSLYDTKIFTDNTPDKNVRFTQNESLTNLTTVSNQNNKYNITNLNNENKEYKTKFLKMEAHPSNSINIFGQPGQIIGIFNVKNAETGEHERLLKIQLLRSYSSQFDTNGTNNWNTSSLMQELNVGDSSYLNELNQYYTNSSSSSSSSSNPSYHEYNSYFGEDNNFEINDLTDLISNVEWDIGGLDSLNISLENAYKQEKGLSPYVSNKKTWTGKIGLPSLTDFLYNKLGADCASDLSTCSTLANLSAAPPFLTLTKDNTSTTNVYVYNNSIYLPETADSGSVYPTFYLKKDIKFVCGDGTVNNVYAITPSECGKLYRAVG